MPKRGSGDIPENPKRSRHMDLLQQARAEIDTVDAEMAALFERRMRAVADVVRYKAETGKPVLMPRGRPPCLTKHGRITD